MSKNDKRGCVEMLRLEVRLDNGFGVIKGIGSI